MSEEPRNKTNEIIAEINKTIKAKVSELYIGQWVYEIDCGWRKIASITGENITFSDDFKSTVWEVLTWENIQSIPPPPDLKPTAEPEE